MYTAEQLEELVARAMPDAIVASLTNLNADAKGVLRLTSADAVQYAVTGAVPKGIPVITAGARTPTPAGLRAASGAVAALASHKAPPVTSLSVDGGLVQVVLGSVTVVWGDGSSPDQKAAVAMVLLRTTPRPTLIDVSAPTATITR